MPLSLGRGRVTNKNNINKTRYNRYDCLEGDNDEEGVGIFLSKHMRCASYTLNLVATTDAGKALNKCAIYKKYCRSAFAKAQEIWNKLFWSSNASDVIKDNIGFLLHVPTVPNSVYDAVGRLIAIFENRDNLKAFNQACTILTFPLFTNNDMAFFKDYHRVMRPICTALDKLQSEEYVCTGILWLAFFITVKKMRELQTNKNVAVCLPLGTVLIESVQERFDTVLSNTEYQVAMVLHQHFRLSLMSDADN